ncbi:MAG: DUF2892 domain-containing protein [Gammaproteobacteria bacterium]|nr:DUF2892 domain-containing protein [Gammaproteobacteria bacterium]
MNIERIVLAVAGIMAILTSTLAYYHHVYWLFFNAFIGLNLLQSAFTGFCPLASILKMFGKKNGHAFS